MTIQKLRNWARGELSLLTTAQEGPSRVEQEVAWREIDRMLAFVLDCRYSQIFSESERRVEPKRVEHFRELVARRQQFEPLGYILGKQEFFGREFLVSPDVIIPRPDTELVVERALAVLRLKTRQKRVRLIDVGTGSGAIILAMLLALREDPTRQSEERITAIATDIDEKSLNLARKNAQRHGLEKAISFVVADLFTAFSAEEAGVYEIILANPPYIAESEVLPPSVRDYEPKAALVAGPSGLECISSLLSQVEELGKKDMTFIMEIGYQQKNEVESLAKSAGFANFTFHRDLRGFERVIEVTTQ